MKRQLFKGAVVAFVNLGNQVIGTFISLLYIKLTQSITFNNDTFFANARDELYHLDLISGPKHYVEI